jgi:hypothetical protein
LSEPRAAFRLGFLSLAISRPVLLDWLMPWHVRREDWVSYVVSMIRGARFVLIREIHQNVSQELRHVLQEWQDWFRLVEARGKEGDGLRMDASTPPGSWDVTGSEHRRVLKMMADAALPRSHPLRPLYQLGDLLGAYWDQLVAHALSGGRASDLESLPDVGPLVRHIVSLPSAYLDQLPELRSVAELAPRLDQFGQSTFLALFGDWGVSEVSIAGRRIAYPKVLKVEVRLRELVDSVDQGLGSIESPEPVGEGRGATPDGVATTTPQPGSDPAGGTDQGRPGGAEPAGSAENRDAPPEGPSSPGGVEPPGPIGETGHDTTTPAQGYLGLDFNPSLRTLHRKGKRPVVDLSSGKLNRKLVEHFLKKKDALSERGDLSWVWNQAGLSDNVSIKTIYDRMCDLNDLLEPLGVMVDCTSGAWKLIVGVRPDRGAARKPKKTGRVRSPKGKRG